MTVEVFGDPHMKTFEKFVTCSSVGRKPYLVNSYVQIHGTNTPVRDGLWPLPATFLTAVRFCYHNATFRRDGIFRCKQTTLLLQVAMQIRIYDLRGRVQVCYSQPQAIPELH